MIILGVTPARGGSRGVPRKNIKMIAGMPLVAWTIRAAKESKLLTKYIVSTEDAEIAGVCAKFGATVLPRPPELATDEASTQAVLQHAAANVPSDIIVLLQATSPVRPPGLIDECIKEFINSGYDSLATGFICKYQPYGTSTARRQDIPGFFYDDGNVYVIKTELIKQGQMFGKKMGRKIIDRCLNVEIDDEFDLWVDEKILNEKREL